MASLSEYELTLLQTIEEHGWQHSHVFDPSGEAPDFSYSVGFTKALNAPEFIVFGLPRELMSHILWEAYEQIKAGAHPEDGKRWSGMLEGFDCISRKANHPDLFKEYTTSSNWFWKHMGREGHPEVFQLVWPGSRDGLFPWQEKCAQDVIDAQPQLWTS